MHDGRGVRELTGIRRLSTVIVIILIIKILS